jgi:hypothetical protein
VEIWSTPPVRLLAKVFSIDLFIYVGAFHPLRNFAAVLIGLHRDALNVPPRRRSNLMIGRFLRLNETNDLYCDDARIGVAGMMQVQIFNACGHTMLLQVIGGEILRYFLTLRKNKIMVSFQIKR